MKFGPIPTSEARDAILAHSQPLASGKLSKGHRLQADDLARLQAEEVTTVIVCRLEPGDLMEDEAADRLSAVIDLRGLTRSPASTGRGNFYASANGLFRASKTLIDRFNAVDPAITLACLADRRDVRAGDLVATVKIIPLAVAGACVAEAAVILQEGIAFEVAPYRRHRVHLVATQLRSLKPSVMDKTTRVLEARLLPSGSRLASEHRVPHRAETVADAIRVSLTHNAAADDGPPLIIVFGASAVADADDVIPSAIRLAGGVVDQVGLPVDPGNLLVLGHVGDVPVIGAPGCARSPKENGFDWVLNGILAGHPPDRVEMTGWGVGGLLMEIPSRPLPREATRASLSEHDLGAVLLAAGRASRMGKAGHKLLAEFEGVPLVRRVAERALDALPGPVVVVTGHQAAEVSEALAHLPLILVDNPDFATGMASSLKTGLSAPEFAEVAGVMVLLADMPALRSEDLQRLSSAFLEAQGRAIVRAVANGKRGNPVILPRATFADLMLLEGDVGARQVIETCGLPIIDVELGAAAYIDVDTPEAVQAAGGILKG